MTETEDYATTTTPEAHAESHEDDGSDEVDVGGLSGELADEQDAGKIKGKLVPAPVLADDEKALVYDHDTGQFKYATTGLVAHASTHENGGSDEVNVGGLSGELADEQSAGKIKGKTVPAPVVGDDEKALVYDHDTLSFKYVAPGLISNDVYGAGWNGVTTIGASKNALYDEIELRTKATAIITDNKLIRGNGGARGVQESTIIVDDSGRMTNPSQPAFCGVADGTQINIVAGGYRTVEFSAAERFDQGNDFASHTFTAPITGRYQFNVIVYITSVDNASERLFIQLNTSNKNYYLGNIEPNKVFSADSLITHIGVLLADMDINDTAYVQIYQLGGANQADIQPMTFFSGFLAC